MAMLNIFIGIHLESRADCHRCPVFIQCPTTAVQLSAHYRAHPGVLAECYRWNTRRFRVCRLGHILTEDN